jgi:tRNA threonylcarbamoyladenosine biosynthesis protein TsaE
MQTSFFIKTVGDWRVFAERLVLELKPGMMMALSGPLGAGKTTFVQALAQVLGVKEVPVSPTFSLVRTYKVKNHPFIRQLVHVDAYRIERAEDIITLGLDELLEEPGTIVCLEWPEQVEGWLQGYRERVLWLEIAPKDEGREVVVVNKYPAA